MTATSSPPITTVKVTCGANSRDVAPGQTVGQVRKAMTDTMNIPKDAAARVGGNVVDGATVLKSGDQLEFVKPSGVKG